MPQVQVIVVLVMMWPCMAGWGGGGVWYGTGSNVRAMVVVTIVVVVVALEVTENRWWTVKLVYKGDGCRGRERQKVWRDRVNPCTLCPLPSSSKTLPSYTINLLQLRCSDQTTGESGMSCRVVSWLAQWENFCAPLVQVVMVVTGDGGNGRERCKWW